MATRSTIGIQNDDNSIDVVYCHWDGYLEGVGRILKENYNTEEKIRELLSYGNVSSLGNSIKDCSFYMRDRQETEQELEKVNSQEEYKRFFEEYNYLWINDEWLYSHLNDNIFKQFKGDGND
jgi:hypothetical protein